MSGVLEGVRVIDFGQFIAGPQAGMLLADQGADVVRVEPPGGPRWDTPANATWNRGKRSIVLDLKRGHDLDIARRLIQDADVVVQNFRKGVAERLGIGYEQVRQRRPDIVYASVNTYGQEGPWAMRPGHEQIAQAATGMQERYGGEGPPVLQPYPVNDYGTGFMGAYGVALALIHRGRTGVGQHVDTALAHTACTLQSQFLQDYAGKHWDEPRGQQTLGSGPLNRAYQAGDGWLFLSARGSDLPVLAKIHGLEGVDRLSGVELETALAERLLGAPVADWVGRLTAAGVGAHRLVFEPRELLSDPWVMGAA